LSWASPNWFAPSGSSWLVKVSLRRIGEDMYHSAAAIARLHGDPRNSVINADFCCTCAPQHWLVCASALACPLCSSRSVAVSRQSWQLANR
jgi:hypothetical protein